MSDFLQRGTSTRSNEGILKGVTSDLLQQATFATKDE